MLHQVKSYIKFLIKSTNKHGVHSPFVFDLVTKCFYDTKKHSVYNDLEQYKYNLLNSKESIEVTDLGKGSRVSNKLSRSIKSIAKNAGSTNKRAQLLFRLSNYFKPNNSLELGTSLGIATYALHKGNIEGNITSIEGCPNIASFTTQNLKQNNTKNISIINSDISNSLDNFKDEVFDFVFLDGNHQKKPTLQYFESLLNNIKNDSIFIFDDIYWSKEMTDAWNIIKKHPKVTVTIDCFWCGFVFFRKEQEKEHFVIRL
ncbi:O-methyltransferase [Aurantibacter sp.]|uniref:O-methyltransferase n=1 Tax=Aurantibacter sp. TaxID=2807103 RepID=UPI0035C82889